MKGKSARFRASRMRLLMTMSDSGPEPRSHSPLVRASSVEFHGLLPGISCQSRPMTRRLARVTASRGSFNLPNLVAQLRGPLVVLAGDASFISRRRRINSVWRSVLPGDRSGRLPTCSQLAVDVHDQRFQLLLKADVIVRAAQPPLVAELEERDPADRDTPAGRAGPVLRPSARPPTAAPAPRPGSGLAGCSGSDSVRYSRACSSQRCNSCGLPPVNSVMWKVAGLSQL